MSLDYIVVIKWCDSVVLNKSRNSDLRIALQYRRRGLRQWCREDTYYCSSRHDLRRCFFAWLRYSHRDSLLWCTQSALDARRTRLLFETFVFVVINSNSKGSHLVFPRSGHNQPAISGPQLLSPSLFLFSSSDGVGFRDPFPREDLRGTGARRGIHLHFAYHI